jgi:hypothetical protein
VKKALDSPACLNFHEAKLASSEVGPMQVAVKPNEKKSEESSHSKRKRKNK